MPDTGTYYVGLSANNITLSILKLYADATQLDRQLRRVSVGGVYWNWAFDMYGVAATIVLTVL